MSKAKAEIKAVDIAVKTENEAVIYKLDPDAKSQLRLISASRGRGMGDITAQVMEDWIERNRVVVTPAE